MTDLEIRKRIERSMEASLSGLHDDPFMTRRVLLLSREGKGEKKVVKKLSRGLIFAIVLVLALVTAALALTNWDQLKGYFETVRTMDTSGELAKWSDENKIKLLTAMHDAGIATDEDERVKKALDESLPITQRGAAADAVITERYGESYFDSHTVEELELDRFKLGKDEQAEYEKWNDEFWEEWLAKGKQPITEGRILRENINNLTEIGDFPYELLREVKVSYEWDEYYRQYIVTASIDKETYMAGKERIDQYSKFDLNSGGYEDGDMLCFDFYLDEYGEFAGFQSSGLPEDRAEITLEEGLPIAIKALKDIWNVDKEELDGLKAESTYGEGSTYNMEDGRFDAICFYYWNDSDDKSQYSVSLDARTGLVESAIDWRKSEAMREKERVWIAEMTELLTKAGVSGTLRNESNINFIFWSIEEKAAWSRVARPIVQKYLEEHEEFTEYMHEQLTGKYSWRDWDNLISLTLHAYGVPDNKAITEEKAFDIARARAIELGAKPSYIDNNEKNWLLYDVTDPERPLWRVNLCTTFGADDTKHPYDPTAPWGYSVVIDANTGKVLNDIIRTVNTYLRDIA